MSSKAGRSREGICAPCLIGKRVVLALAPQHSIAAQASRQFDFQAGTKAFSAFQMGETFESAALETIATSSSLDDFARSAGLGDGERTSLFRAVYGSVAPMFRLLGDERFVALTESLLATANLPEGSAKIDAVSGIDTAIATVPARLRLTDDSVIISHGEKIAVGRVGSVDRFLGRDNDSERLAAVDFTSMPADGPSLVVTPKGLARLALTIERHEDLEAFTRAHDRSPDRLSLLRSRDDQAAVELDVFARRGKARATVSEPILGVQFTISSYASMKHGLFASGWFLDPDGLLESVIAVDHSLAETEVSDVWLCFPATLKTGENTERVTRFAAFLPREEDVVAPHTTTFRVKLSNGENYFVQSPRTAQDTLSQRGAILDAIADYAFDVDALSGTYQPALAPLQAEINSRQFVRETVEYGVRSSRRVSIIIPLYKEKGFIRSQLIAFDVDPFIRAHCEIVYVLDDPLMALRIKQILGGAVHVHRLDIKLVILGRNGGYALANNFGVAESDGETVVLMNSDVIPEKGGWLEPLLGGLARLPAASVIGPKLIYADESLQHAGMYFYRLVSSHWQNMHYYKGYGRALPPADVEREVPAVTGALMVLRKQDYLAAGGFTSDYVVGDYEDSDLCLKLRAVGGTCLYMPSVALFHFERQSMPDADPDKDIGSTIYNRALHTSRWNDTIEALMARFDGADHAI